MAVTKARSNAVAEAAKGDLTVGSGTNASAVLTVGTTNQTILADSTQTTGVKWGASPQSLMTATGDTLYASGANTPAKLAIGSTGQVLTVSGGIPAWSTPSGGAPSWSLLSTTSTNTSTTAVTISGLSGYNQFMIRFAGIGATAGTNFSMTFNGVDTGSKYFHTGANLIGTASFNSNLFTTNGTSAGDSLDMGGINTSGTLLNGYMFLQGGNGSGLKVGHYVIGANNNSAGSTYRWRAFTFDTASVISSLTLTQGSGSLNAGNIYIYGSVN